MRRLSTIHNVRDADPQRGFSVRSVRMSNRCVLEAAVLLAEKEQAFNAQHGAVRVLVKDGVVQPEDACRR
jgi:hypothetical protein